MQPTNLELLKDSWAVTALKRIEIDHLLRTETFVDLYSIVRQSVRAGIEKYSIKDLEQFYGYERKAKLEELVPVKRLVEHSIELSQDWIRSQKTLKVCLSSIIKTILTLPSI